MAQCPSRPCLCEFLFHVVIVVPRLFQCLHKVTAPTKQLQNLYLYLKIFRLKPILMHFSLVVVPCVK